MDYPFVIPVLISWTSIVAIVITVFVFAYMKSRAKYRLLESLAEKGQTLTPEMLASINFKANWKSDEFSNPIGSGISLMCIGVALAIFFWALQGFPNIFLGEHVNFLPAVGIFPFMIGLSRILSAVFTGRSPEAAGKPDASNADDAKS